MNLLKLRQKRPLSMTYTRSLVVLVTLHAALTITSTRAAGINPVVPECDDESYYDTTWYQCRPCGEGAIQDPTTGKPEFACSDG